MNKPLLCLIKLMVFICILILIMAALSNVFLRKETLVRYGGFLEQPKNHDVLIVGDSHSVNGIYPMQLWKDYGITSYNLSGIGNTLPVTYWVTRLALDRMTPKVVVIGVKDVGYTEKLTASSGDLHTALDCFPISRTKVEAVLDLTDNPYAADDDGNHF
ncbi:MAG: hypothetical protein IJ242_04185, partial [Clostridia bacterium]|nr:hypothetical protein [Clostridia bacterium]